MKTTKMPIEWIKPDWPAPDNIHAFCSTRMGGIRKGQYAGLNLAEHVDDDPLCVAENRQRLISELQLPSMPLWLQQVHGNHVINYDEGYPNISADGCYSTSKHQVCVVMTADCLPILMCDQQGTQIAAVHAGWRGLASQIIAAMTAKFTTPCNELLVWLGPAISAPIYEVDTSVRDRLATVITGTEWYKDTRPGHGNLDLLLIARLQLQERGIIRIYGGDYCTYHQSKYFFSHRRVSPCGRMASLIWLENHSDAAIL